MTPLGPGEHLALSHSVLDLSERMTMLSTSSLICTLGDDSALAPFNRETPAGETVNRIVVANV